VARAPACVVTEKGRGRTQEGGEHHRPCLAAVQGFVGTLCVCQSAGMAEAGPKKKEEAKTLVS